MILSLSAYTCGSLRLSRRGKTAAECAAVVSNNLWTRNLIIGQYSGQIASEFQVKGRIKDVRVWHRGVARGQPEPLQSRNRKVAFTEPVT